MAMGLAAPHQRRSMEKIDSSPPEVQFDFKYMTKAGDIVELGGAVYATILTAVDVASMTPLAVAVKREETTDGFLAVSLVAFADRLSLGRMVQRTDGELATAKLASIVRDLRAQKGVPTEVQLTQRYSLQSIGAVGKIQQQLQGQIRVLALDVKRRFGVEPAPSMCLWPWLVRHAAWLIERFHRKGSGHTCSATCLATTTAGLSSSSVKL